MTQPTAHPTQQAPSPTVQGFAHFWANPNLSMLPAALAEDVVGHFPGDAEPVQGRDNYIARIGRFLDLVPSLRLTVAEHATNGDSTFIRWIARGTGAAGAFEFSGIDRIKVRDGLVVENVVVFDTAVFKTLIDGSQP
jgi:SnoaL-like domain